MEFYLNVESRKLLEEFESAFSDAWFAAQEILKYIDDEYNGDKERFLYEVAHNCDYFSAAKALKSIFDHSEN